MKSEFQENSARLKVESLIAELASHLSVFEEQQQRGTISQLELQSIRKSIKQSIADLRAIPLAETKPSDAKTLSDRVAGLHCALRREP
jgi:hypothetical protein